MFSAGVLGKSVGVLEEGLKNKYPARQKKNPKRLTNRYGCF